MGYETWDAYVEGEFKKPPLALPREERQAAVQSLRSWGLSTRAIAPLTGASVATTKRDVAQNEPPDPTANVTGMDGKTYTPPVRAPKQRRRRPLPDVARDLERDLKKVTDRLSRLHDDDRFDANKEVIASHLFRLESTIDVCQAVFIDLYARDRSISHAPHGDRGQIRESVIDAINGMMLAYEEIGAVQFHDSLTPEESAAIANALAEHIIQLVMLRERLRKPMRSTYR